MSLYETCISAILGGDADNNNNKKKKGKKETKKKKGDTKQELPKEEGIYLYFHIILSRLSIALLFVSFC